MRSRTIINQTFNKMPRNECFIQNQKLILEVMLDIRDFCEIIERKLILLNDSVRSRFPTEHELKVKDATLRQMQQSRFNVQNIAHIPDLMKDKNSPDTSQEEDDLLEPL